MLVVQQLHRFCLQAINKNDVLLAPSQEQMTR